MIAATKAIQRPASARLLHMDAHGHLVHAHRYDLVSFINCNDLLIANDAATLPASLFAVHERTGAQVEVRLAGRESLDAHDVLTFSAVLFGEGDYRTRTEDRAQPPVVRAGDRLLIGAATATIESVLDHPRFVRLQFQTTPAEVWRLLATHGRPIQYAHLHEPLELWDVWTSIAAAPVAYEPPSAGFALDWSLLTRLRAKGATFATLTHAAGISSTGDPQLDRRLPLNEPYVIPAKTSEAIERSRTAGGRVIAVGTTVVRALEHAASRDGHVAAGAGVADQRIGPTTRLRAVDALLSGTHEVGTSHYELLRAFVSDDELQRFTQQLNEGNYLTHEFGDSILIEAERLRDYMRATSAALSRKAVAVRKIANSQRAVCGA